MECGARPILADLIRVHTGRLRVLELRRSKPHTHGFGRPREGNVVHGLGLIAELQQRLAVTGYVADGPVATALVLMQKLGRQQLASIDAPPKLEG